MLPYMPSLSTTTTLTPNFIQWRIIFTTGALFSLGVLAGGLWNKQRASILPSPLKTLLPTLSESEFGDLPYPPDVLPGVRDVDTPYGSIRVYEFGPETGRKVLLVHGISTPAIALGSVANALVANGCRVMLFDLFGRGYSDTPGDVPHDMRLFTTQICLVLASSPLPWTGGDAAGFSLIGYSLGGAISMTFTSYFPDLVDSLILFCPAGLVRSYRISKTSRLIYSEGIIPETLLRRLVRRRLRSPIAQPPPKASGRKGDEKIVVDATDAVAAEVKIPKVKLESNSQAVLSTTRPHVTVEKTVLFQLDNYAGFMHAFMSSIRYGPVRAQHDRWRLVGKRLTAQNHLVDQTNQKKKVLIVLGKNDPIIVQSELEEDAKSVLGEENVEFVAFDAGHEVPVTKGEEIVKKIMEFWERTG